MKKHSAIFLTLLALLVVIGIPTVFVVREYRHEQANRGLIDAILRNDTSAALDALQHGADANARDHSEDKPLALSDQLRCYFDKLIHPKTQPVPDTRPVALRVLLDLQVTYDDPRPPADNPEIAKALLDYGADVNAKDENGGTALVKAAHDGKYKILRLLAKRGGMGTFDEDMSAIALNRAITEGECEDVRILLDQKISVDTRYDRMPALMIAYSKGKKDVVALLLQRHVDVNLGMRWNRTPLLAAVQAEHIEIARVLLEHGADWRPAEEAGGTVGDTALSLAQRTEQSEMVKLLKRYGAKR
jgi:ankyrin repeat protein